MKVLIADDELLARKRLTRLISELAEVELVGECSSGDEVLARLVGDEAPAVDVLLLDIRMPGLSGLETKAVLGDDGPYVVFVTAHEDHAVEAFDVGAVDYLLKPVDLDRLRRALDRAARLLGLEAKASTTTSDRPNGDPSDRLAVQTRDGVVLLDPAEIDCAVLDSELVTLWTARGDFIVDQSLQRLEERLAAPGPGCEFVRAHRRVLINLGRVQRFASLSTGGYDAWFSGRDGEPARSVPVSRQAARALRRRFGL